LKGTTGYAKSAASTGPNVNAAVDKQTLALRILDLQPYNFTDTGEGNTTITSTNRFKKNPGIGGLVQDSTGTGIPTAKVVILQDTKTMGTVYTDADGWYMWAYKWTGKAAIFTVNMWPYAPYSSGLKTQTVTLKANGYLTVNFTVVP
jgi:hypothetical protein